MNMIVMGRLQAAHDPYSFYYMHPFSFPSVFDNPYALRPVAPPQLPTRQAIQPAQPALPQAGDPVDDLLALAWNAAIKAREPQWEKDSPGSLAIYKLSDGLASSPNITAEVRKWLNVVKALTALYGLDKSGH